MMNSFFRAYLKSELLELYRTASDAEEKEEARKLWEELTGEAKVPDDDDLRSPSRDTDDWTQEEEPCLA